MLKKLQSISFERAKEEGLVPDIKKKDIGPVFELRKFKPKTKKMGQLLRIEISLRKCERLGVFGK